jgi:hypothetical protein
MPGKAQKLKSPANILGMATRISVMNCRFFTVKLFRLWTIRTLAVWETDEARRSLQVSEDSSFLLEDSDMSLLREVGKIRDSFEVKVMGDDNDDGLPIRLVGDTKASHGPMSVLTLTTTPTITPTMSLRCAISFIRVYTGRMS